jgi:parvulin-like peptidyl-prolyl isomerase
MIFKMPVSTAAFLFVFYLFSFFFFSCEFRDSAVENAAEAEQITRSVTLAQVADFEISVRHFQNKLNQFAERTGQGVNLSTDVQKSILEDRLSRYAMVAYALDQGWDREPELQHERTMIERKVWMEAFLRDVVELQVQVSEQDLRTLFHRLNTTLRASHIQADTEEEANSIKQKLLNGASFDELARVHFETPALKYNGGDLGYFTVDDMDISFEDRAYQMAVGEISEPVKTNTGYSIIQLTDRVETPAVTEQQFAEKKRDLTLLAFRQKRELAIRSHMRDTIESFSLNEELLRQIWDIIRDDRSAYTTDGFNEESFLASVPESLRSQVLARQPSFLFDVADFVQEARYTTKKQRSRVTSLPQFREQVEGMIYRRFVLEMAFRNESIDREYVESSSDETFYNALIERFNESIREMVMVDEEQVRAVFEEDGEFFAPELYLNLAEIPFASTEAAQDGRAMIDGGLSFEEVLRKYTLDIGLVDRGGELGFMALSEFGSMASELAGIQPGEIVGPFEISSHYVVLFRCLGRKEAAPLTYENTKDAISRYLEEMEFERLKQEVIERAKKRFDARIFEDRLAGLTIEQSPRTSN